MGRRPKPKIENLPPKIERLDVIPNPPPTLAGVGRDYWLRVAPMLAARGALTGLHLEPFEALCDQWGQYQRLKTWLAEDPGRWTEPNGSGRQVESVQARQLRAVLSDLNRLWARFGLTPHAEPRLSPKAAGGQAGGTRGAKGMTLEEWAALKTIGDEDGRPGK